MRVLARPEPVMLDLRRLARRGGLSTLRLESDGAQLHSSVLSGADIESLRLSADQLVEGQPGARLRNCPAVIDAASADGPLGRIATRVLRGKARPVRAVMFDKTSANNWRVGWHQDRTIAVRKRLPAPGFGPWSTKAGVVHVEPPFELISRMVTLRAHLDECDEDNAPLLIAVGSHALGKTPARDAADVAHRLGVAQCLAITGDVWVYSTSILHASEPAVRPRRRRVLQVDYTSRELPYGLDWAGIAEASPP